MLNPYCNSLAISKDGPPKETKQTKQELKGTVSCMDYGRKLQIEVVSRRNLIKTTVTALAAKSIKGNPAEISNGI